MRCFNTGRGVCAPSPAGTSCCSHRAVTETVPPCPPSSMALAWESETSWITKTPGMIQSQQWDHVCQDRGSAGPSSKKALLAPQQEQLKQQHSPENAARPHFGNASSQLVFTGSFMSCVLLASPQLQDSHAHSLVSLHCLLLWLLNALQYSISQDLAAIHFITHQF